MCVKVKKIYRRNIHLEQVATRMFYGAEGHKNIPPDLNVVESKGCGIILGKFHVGRCSARWTDHAWKLRVT